MLFDERPPRRYAKKYLVFLCTEYIISANFRLTFSNWSLNFASLVKKKKKTLIKLTVNLLCKTTFSRYPKLARFAMFEDSVNSFAHASCPAFKFCTHELGGQLNRLLMVFLSSFFEFTSRVCTKIIILFNLDV